MPLQQLSCLRRDHIVAEGQALVVRSGRYQYRCEPHHTNPAWTPTAVCRRWMQVLVFTDRHPSTRILAERLRRGRLPDITDDQVRDGLVSTSIDRWGYLPQSPQSTEYYDRGIESRHDAVGVLADVGDVLDDVEARADALLAQTLEIINQWATPAGTPSRDTIPADQPPPSEDE